MEFRILGPLEVVDADRPLPLGGERQRALLALLLTRANEVVSTDRLIDELWGMRPPKQALNTIQYYISQLRKTLGADRIVTRAPGYMIRVEPTSSTSRASNSSRRTGAPSRCTLPWSFGAGLPWPTSRTSRSPVRRRAGSRSSASSCRSGASTPTSKPGGLPSS